MNSAGIWEEKKKVLERYRGWNRREEGKPTWPRVNSGAAERLHWWPLLISERGEFKRLDADELFRGRFDPPAEGNRG